MRIVTLLPSATEIVCRLGLRDSLVGVTHECDHPADVVGLPVVTRSHLPPEASSVEIDRLVSQRLATEPSLYALDSERLADLRPDLVITQTLCEVCAVARSEVEAFCAAQPSPPALLNLNPTSLEGVLGTINEIAAATGVPERGAELVAGLRGRIDRVAESTREREPVRVALLEWLDPPFAAGHWNPTLVRLAGGVDVLGRENAKSQRVEWADLASADPDAIVVACCGYSAGRAQQDLEALRDHPEWANLRAVREGHVAVMDGSQYFNRPGPRLVDGLEKLARKLRGWSAER